MPLLPFGKSGTSVNSEGENMQIVLASASPRRRELLKELVPDFRVLPAKGEERADPSLSPEETVKELARRQSPPAIRTTRFSVRIR